MAISDQVKKVLESLKDYPNVNLIAATKYMSIEQTRELYNCGIRNFGENRTDMFLEKYEALKDCKDIKWHFIGVLQSRKIKDVVNKIDCLHSLDKYATAVELSKKLEKPLDCFIQVNISNEPNKQGIPVNKVKNFIKQLKSCENIRVVGLMCIGLMTFDEEEIKYEFTRMKQLQEEIALMNLDYAPCTRLSMGMSNDYLMALECGTTDVRLGRIFLK